MQTVQIEFWQMLSGAFGLLCLFVSVTWLFGVILVRQFETRQNERFKSMEEARLAADSTMKEELQRHTTEEGKTTNQIAQLERDFLKWQAELPIQYVRREDYVRGQSVIEAKLDALFSELKYVQIKGNNNG